MRTIYPHIQQTFEFLTNNCYIIFTQRGSLVTNQLHALHKTSSLGSEMRKKQLISFNGLISNGRSNKY